MMHTSVYELNLIESKRGSLIHIETAPEHSEGAGIPIVSINKKWANMAALFYVSPQLLDLAYRLTEGQDDLDSLKQNAQALINKFNASFIGKPVHPKR